MRGLKKNSLQYKTPYRLPATSNGFRVALGGGARSRTGLWVAGPQTSIYLSEPDPSWGLGKYDLAFVYCFPVRI